MITLIINLNIIINYDNDLYELIKLWVPFFFYNNNSEITWLNIIIILLFIIDYEKEKEKSKVKPRLSCITNNRCCIINLI